MVATALKTCARDPRHIWMADIDYCPYCNHTPQERANYMQQEQTTSNALAKLDKATHMLAEAKTLDEVKGIMDIAEAARVYARAAKLGLEAYNHAAEVKVRAERKAGEMLRQLERPSQGNPQFSQAGKIDNIFQEVIQENDIPKTTAYRWQQLAEMPELVFEKHLEEERGERPITTSGIIQDVRRAKVRNDLESVEAQEAKTLEGVYDVIVIDPPWQMEKIEREERPNQTEFDYPTMGLDEISRLEIPAADNCHVWLWTTQKFLPHAFGLFAAWDVRYVCTFNWHKNGGFQPFGLPQYNNEFVLYGKIGSPSFLETKDFKTSFEGKRGKHSEKPGEFYDTVRRVTAGRRLDMFNRRKIEGFDGWGKEAG
jgi:N6-adenosine-specific RNA methylase IME4